MSLLQPGLHRMRLLQLLIFGLPWVAIPGIQSPYLEAKDVVLQAGLWLLVCWTLFRFPLATRYPANPWMGPLAAYLVLMGLWHFQVAYLLRTPTQPQAIYNVYTWLPTIVALLGLFSIRLLAIGYLRTSSSVHLMTQWWCLSAVLTAGYALLQAIGLDQFYRQPEPVGSRIWEAITGSFGNPEYLAVYLAILLPLFLLFEAKRYLVYLGLCVTVIALTRISGAWIIACVGLLSYLLSRYWLQVTAWQRISLLVLSVGLVIGGLWSNLSLVSGDERWTIWQHAWALLVTQEAKSLPVFTGYGLGFIALKWAKTSLLWVHNEWLQMLVEIGVIGTGLMGLVVWSTTQRAWRNAQGSLLDSGWFGVWMAWGAASVILPSAHWAHTAWIGLCAWAVHEREEPGYA